MPPLTISPTISAFPQPPRPATGLVPVRVPAWAVAWADADALTGTLRPHREPVFLGPFDNMIWYRPRTLRLFGFTQVFEAYKPAARRRHGSYVCPLLADGRLIGRADLAGRGDNLTVLRVGLEPHAGQDTAHHFARACRTLACGNRAQSHRTHRRSDRPSDWGRPAARAYRRDDPLEQQSLD